MAIKFSAGDQKISFVLFNRQHHELVLGKHIFGSTGNLFDGK